MRHVCRRNQQALQYMYTLTNQKIIVSLNEIHNCRCHLYRDLLRYGYHVKEIIISIVLAKMKRKYFY